MYRSLIHLLALVALFAAGGASCPMMRRQMTEPFPVVFTQPPTLEDVVRVVNANSDLVQQLQADTVRMKVDGFPALNASLAVERPNRLRLRGQLMSLAAVDLGSNDELFWMWIKDSQPPGVYYVRHDQFVQSGAAGMLGVDPRWLIDALGLARFEPADHHQGPYADQPGRLKILSKINTGAGPVTKMTSIDEKYGWVLEQHVYDARGALVASSTASDHRYYHLPGVSLPQRVEIQLIPPAEAALGTTMQFTLSISDYTINRIAADASQLWAMPQFEGYPLVDLANPPTSPPQAALPQHPQAALDEAARRLAQRPRYRGDTLSETGGGSGDESFSEYDRGSSGWR